MSKIFNLRGPGGSGKSWIVHELMRQFGFVQKSDHVLIGEWLIVVGRYAGLKGGGTDNLKMDDVEFLVKALSKLPYKLLFEGGVISRSYKRWKSLSQQMNIKFLVLNTPSEMYVERRYKRCKLPYPYHEAKSFLKATNCLEYEVVDWRNPIESILERMGYES